MALLAGRLKAHIQSSITASFSNIQIWAYVNQSINLINVAVYSLSGWLIQNGHLSGVSVALIITTAIFAFIVLTEERRSRRALLPTNTVAT